MIHLDNAHPHNSRRSQECIAAFKGQRLPHPSDSPDLAPGDFFLFGYLKEKLMDFNCETLDDLKTVIAEIFNEISKEQLTVVFVSWMKPLKWVHKNMTDSTTTSEQKINSIASTFIETMAGHEHMNLLYISNFL
jgi:hypothetical protein